MGSRPNIDSYQAAIIRLGPAGARAIATRKKRQLRMKNCLRAGQPVNCGGTRHPADCPCYDCLYGEVAAMKKAIHTPFDVHGQAEQFHRTGRVRRSRMAVGN